MEEGSRGDRRGHGPRACVYVRVYGVRPYRVHDRLHGGTRAGSREVNATVMRLREVLPHAVEASPREAEAEAT